MSEPAALLNARSICKRFGDFTANDAVSLTIAPGSIHALLGENGAGKSTFVKMLYGVMQPDEGEFIWQGDACRIISPKAARAMGIAMVFQHFSLFPALTVAENIALALDADRSPAQLRRDIIDAAQRWGLQIDPDHPVGALSVGEQQRVEILRCLLQDPKLLIMDEPTSVLTPQETTQLFTVLRRLADDGCAILYISHKLDEIMALADTATILRHGRNVGEVTPKKSSTRKMAEMMVGSSVDWIERRPDDGSGNDADDGKALMKISGLNRPAESHFATALQSISMDIRHGEIIGIAGVSGNGQEELAEALSGEWRSGTADAISFESTAVGHLGPDARRRLGIETVPEERNGHAAVTAMSLADNTFLTRYSRYAAGLSWIRRIFVNPASAQDDAHKIVAENDVRTPHENPLASQLSGGNLQKFIMGRMLVSTPKLAIVNQPTWGVDVGAATAIRRALISLADNGCSIVLISQDLEEILSLAHRIGVLHEGRLSPLQDAARLTAEEIGLLMGGAGAEGDAA